MFKFNLSNLALIAIVSSATPFIVIDRSVAQSVDTSNPNKVLRSTQGQTLTQGMLDDWIEFGEFLAGSSFTPLEKQLIMTDSTVKFHHNPQDRVNWYNNFSKTMASIREANPVARTKVKEAIFTKFYLENLKKDYTNVPEDLLMMVKVVDNYVKVVAVDTEAGIVVTQEDIDSLFAGYNFYAELIGQPLRNSVDTAKIQQTFSQMPLEKKQYLANGESTWKETQVAWANMSPEQQQNFKNEMIAKVNHSNPTPSQNQPTRNENSNNETTLQRNTGAASKILLDNATLNGFQQLMFQIP